MRRCWILILLLVAGCATPPPLESFQRMILTVPSAGAASVRVDYTCPFGHSVVTWTNNPIYPTRVYVDLPDKFERDGNSYKMEFYTFTNANSNIPPGENATLDYYNSYLLTNRFPVRRVNAELSLDGGTNFTRRIAVGIQINPDRIRGEFIWSPATDYSLLTERAVFRLTDLDGKCFDNGPTNFPFNLRPGDFVRSSPFTISGAYVTVPAAGEIVYNGVDMTVSFFETGGGSTWDIGWITQADQHFHPFATVSNAVGGIINTSIKTCTIPVASEVKLLIWSQLDRALIGRGPVFSVE